MKPLNRVKARTLDWGDKRSVLCDCCGGWPAPVRTSWKTGLCEDCARNRGAVDTAPDTAP